MGVHFSLVYTSQWKFCLTVNLSMAWKRLGITNLMVLTKVKQHNDRKNIEKQKYEQKCLKIGRMQITRSVIEKVCFWEDQIRWDQSCSILHTNMCVRFVSHICLCVVFVTALYSPPCIFCLLTGPFTLPLVAEKSHLLKVRISKIWLTYRHCLQLFTSKSWLQKQFCLQLSYKLNIFG